MRWFQRNIGFLHATGAVHYPLEGITMLAAFLIRLPSRLAAQVMQAMFFSDGEKCHPTDLHVEHRVKDVKDILRRLGQEPGDVANLTECAPPTL